MKTPFGLAATLLLAAAPAVAQDTDARNLASTCAIWTGSYHICDIDTRFIPG